MAVIALMLTLCTTALSYSDEDWKRKVVYIVYIAWNGMDLVYTKAMAYVNTYRGC